MEGEDRRAEIVRLIVTRRERAPRPPRMERALKRLLWRYCLSDESNKKTQERKDNEPRDH